jgi:hypothetical protein
MCDRFASAWNSGPSVVRSMINRPGEQFDDFPPALLIT